LLAGISFAWFKFKGTDCSSTPVFTRPMENHC
jgi:hypothetical protein